MRTRASVDVFGYRDFRAFLRAHYAHRKAQKNGFSLRAFSRRVGLKSPNYLKLVMDGDRNLTPELSHVFAEACGLSGDAVEYFCTLVVFNQAKSAGARELHYARLKSFARYRAKHKLDGAQEAYHAHWYVPAIRELCVRSDFDEDPKWIAKTLWPAISPAQARNALSVLCELGLLVRDANGRLVQAEPLVETPDAPLGHHVAQFHRAMIGLGLQAIDRVPRSQREIASLTMCISALQLDELKTDLEAIRERLLQQYVADADAEHVVQVNFQMFPLSKGKD
jgi:uncharacterized protein (TIGR02147 family)